MLFNKIDQLVRFELVSACVWVMFSFISTKLVLFLHKQCKNKTQNQTNLMIKIYSVIE